MPGDATLRVLLASADPLARAALAARLQGEAGIVLAQASTPAADPAADVVVWDPGLEAGALEQLPDVAAALLVIVPDEEAGADAIAAGAKGVLLRGGDPAELAPALRALAAGLAVLDPAVLAAAAPAREAPAPAEELTPREREVLQLVAEGMSNRAIAARLGISDHTAKFHVNAILSKLGVRRRSEAVARAARLGLVVF